MLENEKKLKKIGPTRPDYQNPGFVHIVWLRGMGLKAQPGPGPVLPKPGYANSVWARSFQDAVKARSGPIFAHLKSVISCKIQDFLNMAMFFLEKIK